MNIPTPIFQNKLSKISWEKIYAREYGVQYSEMAILCLSPRAKYHIPKPSVNQVVIPEENNTAFFIDGTSWIELVESLNSKYTTHIQKLEDYEKQFIIDGANYLKTAKKISRLSLKKLSNKELKYLYLDYQEKLFRYSVFAWTSFILNNFISEKAKTILDKYIKKYKRQSDTQELYNSLFKPEKLAAILELQTHISKHENKLSDSEIDKLYGKFRWLSCLDIHNNPWTKEKFKEHIKSLSHTQTVKIKPFMQYQKELKIDKNDSDYLQMVKRFVYIKDARDDFRRQGVFYARSFFKELARRMKIQIEDVSFLQQSEITDFLTDKLKINQKVISDRKTGFVLYLDKDYKLICLTGKNVDQAVKEFHLLTKKKAVKLITGMVASRGMVSGKVVIVKGIKDLHKVKIGDILVAVTTHPDFVPAMRRAAAIITDEGGITSHAAIVSREFGIPCIVGTKNATSLFKDGDLIEVDAIAGKIKLIE